MLRHTRSDTVSQAEREREREREMGCSQASVFCMYMAAKEWGGMILGSETLGTPPPKKEKVEREGREREREKKQKQKQKLGREEGKRKMM